MKNPTLKLIAFAIAGLILGCLPNTAKAQTGQSEYFGVSGGIVNNTTYSWDSANWATGSGGPFSLVWTNGDFARFYGGSGDSYTVTVNQAEFNAGMYNDSTSTLNINDAGNGTGSLVVTNGIQGFLSASGSTTIINVPISSAPGGTAGGIAPESTGNIYLDASNSYTGGTALGDSGNTLTYFNNNHAFGTGGITLNRTGNFSTLLGFGGSLTVSNNVSTVSANTGTYTALNCAAATNTPVTFAGTWTLGTVSLNLRNSGGATSPLTLSGKVSGTGTLYLSANAGGDGTPGTIILSATNSGFTGPIQVTGTNNAYAGNTNVTLQLGVPNAISAASSVVLAGGNLNGGGFNVTNTATLSMSNSSSLYFGGGNMYFANSSALGWSGILDLADWVNGGSIFGGTQFRFGTSSAGLTSAQLADIEFDNNPATLGDAAIDPNGFVYNAAAVPGPSFTVTTANSLISQPNTHGNSTSTSILITRGGSLASSVTINYTLTGTALGSASVNGYPAYPATYTATPSLASSGTIVFAPNETSTNIVITAVADSIARPPTTLTLTVLPSANYALGSPPDATVTILNTAEDEVFAATGAATNMYNVFSNDYTTITLTRWGDTNATAFTVSTYNSYGTAVQGVDYVIQPTTINPGDQSDTAYVNPLINGQIPIDTNNLPYTGNKTIIASVANGSGYTGSTNTATLGVIDDAYPPAPYLYTDFLTNSADSNNWVVTSVNDNMQTNPIDEYISFAYDLYDDLLDPQVQQGYGPIPIPFPPCGATNALRLTVNKTPGPQASSTGVGAAAAVNMYPTNIFLSGNYAIRFSMNLVEGYDPNFTTEGALFGMNHNGQNLSGFTTNWFAGSGVRTYWTNGATSWDSDGIWCWVSVDNGVGTFDNGPSSYIVFTGNGGKLPNTGWEPIAQDTSANYVNNFKTNVFTSSGGPGLAANESPDNAAAPNFYGTWSDVELKQYNNIVTISIDKAPICVYTNTTSFTNGYMMLGYEDPYDSVGGADASVYYSNIRVVQLTPPAITETALQGTNYLFDFTTTDGDLTPASFTVVGATSLNGPYTAIPGATITQLSNGAFQASVPESGPVHFYRINQQL